MSLIKHLSIIAALSLLTLKAHSAQELIPLSPNDTALHETVSICQGSLCAPLFGNTIEPIEITSVDGIAPTIKMHFEHCEITIQGDKLSLAPAKDGTDDSLKILTNDKSDAQVQCGLESVTYNRVALVDEIGLYGLTIRKIGNEYKTMGNAQLGIIFLPELKRTKRNRTKTPDPA